MPGTFDDLWWIVLGALIGWLAFWLIDKFFRRDGEPADTDTVKALENIDTLEAQLKEANDERDSLRKEAETQKAESQRLGGLLENLRETNTEQSQQITNLQAALEAARDSGSGRPATAAGDGDGSGLVAKGLAAAGGLAAGAAAAVGLSGDQRSDTEPGSDSTDAAADAAHPTDETQAGYAALASQTLEPANDAVNAGRDAVGNAVDAGRDRLDGALESGRDELEDAFDSGQDDLESALARDTGAFSELEADDWFDSDDDIGSLDDLSGQFPELDDEEAVPLPEEVDQAAVGRETSVRGMMGRIEGSDLVDDGESDKPGGLLGRLRRAGDQRPN